MYHIIGTIMWHYSTTLRIMLTIMRCIILWWIIWLTLTARCQYQLKPCMHWIDNDSMSFPGIYLHEKFYWTEMFFIEQRCYSPLVWWRWYPCLVNARSFRIVYMVLWRTGQNECTCDSAVRTATIGISQVRT